MGERHHGDRIHWLDRPWQREHGHERGDYVGRVTPIAQQRARRLSDQSLSWLADPLGEVQKSEKRRQAKDALVVTCSGRVN